VNLRSLGRMGRLGVAGAALVVLPLTTACQTKIGTAANVGTEKITTAYLTQVTQRSFAAAAATKNAVPPAQQAEVQRNVLNLLVQVDLLRQIAINKAVSATASDLATERAAEAKAAGGDAALIAQSAQGGLSAKDLPLVIERKVLITKLQSKFGTTDTNTFTKDLTEAASKVRVEVNPRFGAWDPKTLTIVGAPNDLSSPVTSK
jgi:hypothetical protein